MWITKNSGDAAFMRRVDGVSRDTIWVVNHANSPQISKLGLTHVLDGAVDASGKALLHSNGPGLILETNTVAEPGLVPSGGTLFPAGQMASSVLQRNFTEVTANNISRALYDMTAGYDPVYTAKKLWLLKRDMDKVSGPKLCRDFREPQVPLDGFFNMPCCDADGNFSGRYILFNGTVFEAKLFKYTDSPDGTYFLFALSESAIFAPQGCDGTFTTNANLIPLNRNMGWLCVVGEEKDLDWEIIRRFEGNARLVWPVFPNDPKFTRNQFARVFSIVTEARRQGIEMKILRAEANVQSIEGLYEAQETLLDDREIKKLARKYGLEIDPIWNGLPGEIDFNDEPPVREVPPFWIGNRVTMFFGKKSAEFMKELVTRRIRSWLDCKRILVVIDEKDRNLARQVHATGGSKVRIASFDVLKDKHIFLQNVPSLVDMIFIVPPCDDSEMKAVTPEILDVCTQTGLPVGIFSRSPDAPRQEIALDMVCYCVAKSKPAENLFSVKNMDNDTIVNYKFSPSGVEETPGTEEDMSRGE